MLKTNIQTLHTGESLYRDNRDIAMRANFTRDCFDTESTQFMHSLLTPCVCESHQLIVVTGCHRSQYKRVTTLHISNGLNQHLAKGKSYNQSESTQIILS